MTSDPTTDDSSLEETVTHCYLCGGPLSESTNNDHCPPLALFSKEIRQQHNLSQLITIPVHQSCNSSYQEDEQYFQAELIPFAPGSVAGDSSYKGYMAGLQKYENLRLAEKVLQEFELQPGGLQLPAGLVVKRQDGARISRVAYKIVRGLYFHHHRTTLPESISVGCTVTAPGQPPPEHFQLVRDLIDDKTHGLYPGVFDYRFRVLETDLGKLNYWAFLIWDRIIVTVHFHDPWSCQCEDCISAVAAMEVRAGNSAA